MANDFEKVFMFMHDKNSPFYIEDENLETVPVKGFSNGMKRAKPGSDILLHIGVRNLTNIKNMKLRDDDTFVISYPKSGTHWFIEISWLLNHNLDFERATNENQGKRIPPLDIGWNPNFLEQMPSPRTFFTHLPIEFLPNDFHKRCKVIYVIRNPKDIINSFYHFHRKHPFDEYTGSLEDLFNSFMDGTFQYGRWWDHVNQYGALDGIHIVHYEDMIENPKREVKELAKYFGRNDLTDEQIDSIADYCSIEKLSKNPSTDTKAKMFNGKEFMFYRKGKIGDWKNYLTEDMSKAIDKLVEEKLKYNKRPLIFE